MFLCPLRDHVGQDKGRERDKVERFSKQTAIKDVGFVVSKGVGVDWGVNKDTHGR